MIFVAGQYVQRMLSGPPFFEAWRACWRVFRTAMLMLDAALAGQLDEYEERVRVLCITFPGCWGIISKADELMRSGQWERVRRRIEAMILRSLYLDNLDPQMPCGAVIRDSARAQDW